AAVADAIRRHHERAPFDALVTTGDNVYPDGHPSRFGAAWREPYGWVHERGVEVVATLGNHDLETAGGRPVMELLGMPGRWYSRVLGPVEFFVVDSSDPGNTEQLRFLTEAVARSSARWRVAVLHHPPHTCGRKAGQQVGLRRWWGFVLSLAGVDLVLAGHDHNYQRFTGASGTAFVVTGGGGASLYPIEGCRPGTPEPAAAFAAHHFVVAEATDSTLRVEVVRVPGDGGGDAFSLTARR
ncbi:MAG: metallophosphoesterase, partial [Actinomycetota bacterium]|nr:metallophosphoesterase [Actinomycetota bacterium]